MQVKVLQVAPETQAQHFLHQPRLESADADVGDVANGTVAQSLEPLEWRMVRRFPPLVSPGGRTNPKCGNVGIRFPQPISRNQSTMDAFYRYACGSAADFFITDPTLAMTGTMASLEQGCMNLQPWPDMIRASNRTHGEYLYRSCGQRSGEHCSAKNFTAAKVTPITVDEDVLAVSSLRSLPQMDYQHALLDFLAPAWIASNGFRQELLNGSVKMLAVTPWQIEMLKALGMPEDAILQVDIGEYKADSPKLVLCSKRSLHLFRPGGPQGRRLPELPFRDSRSYSDFWHRFFNWQVRDEITHAITTFAGLKEPSASGDIVFLQRCTDRRPIANEQEALSLTRTALTAANRSELLTSVCGSREDFLEQIREMRTARLVIGAHGGALANLLFAPKNAGVLEFVGTAAAHAGLAGVWPPYKSYWYGGAGAAFKFYRVVLYDADAEGNWALELPDYELALQEWLATEKPLQHTV